MSGRHRLAEYQQGVPMTEKLEQTDFTPHLHSTFGIRLDGEAVLPLELVEVGSTGAPHQDPPDNTRAQAFSVLFRGPRDAQLSQQIYALEHEAMGRLELFLVPVGPDREGMLYEAVFA
jgi:hypothetical protein